MDLTTLARVKVLAPIDAGDTTFDALLTRLIASYSASFEVYLGRHAQEVARTEIYRQHRGRRALSLRGAPVLASPAAVIKYEANQDFAGSTALTLHNEYELDLETGLVNFLVPTHLDPGWVQIAYTGGMEDTTANFITSFPAISEACDLQVYHHFKRKDAPGGNVSVAGGSTQYEGQLELLTGVKQVLDLYRRRSV